MSEQPTVRIDGDLKAQRDQLAAMAAEALGQRDRLLFTLGAVLEQFPAPEDVQTVEGRFEQVQSKPVPLRRLREWWTVIRTLKSIDTSPLALAVLASTATEEATQPARVPDLPCPKCGDGDVRLVYCRGWQERSRFLCSNNLEHFHRGCNRCGYDWATFDALDAREAAS